HNNNRIHSITNGVEGQYSVNYTYDSYNRLTHATASAYSRYYTYDAFGNLRTGSGSGGPNPSYTLNYDINSTTAPLNNRLLSVTENGQTQPFYYDNAGNLTQGDGMTYAYDAANRMTSVNNGALGQYGYDGAGMRVKKVEGGGTVWYVRSSTLGNTAIEVTSAGVQRAYVYAGDRLLAQQATDGQFYWSHTNHLGNARAMTEVNGNFAYQGQFDPHRQPLQEGAASGNTNLNLKKFAGHRLDA
ncbi:MAG: RHS repeat protein, partial [Acidobacteria bacterium]|nr:RHS repeat protein [Acidobacteriota bacterium]